jgi:putative addiction module killer protein
MASQKKIKELPEYTAFFAGVSDKLTRAKLLARILRLSLGNPGDSRSVGMGVFEMKIDWGPGWRIYYKEYGDEIVFLLLGGTKSTQQNDIDTAKGLAKKLPKVEGE